MRRIESVAHLICRALRSAACDLQRELARLNNVAEVNSVCSTAAKDRARKVKDWMRERSGNTARCC